MLVQSQNTEYKIGLLRLIINVKHSPNQKRKYRSISLISFGNQVTFVIRFHRINIDLFAAAMKKVYGLNSSNLNTCNGMQARLACRATQRRDSSGSSFLRTEAERSLRKKREKRAADSRGVLRFARQKRNGKSFRGSLAAHLANPRCASESIGEPGGIQYRGLAILLIKDPACRAMCISQSTQNLLKK